MNDQIRKEIQIEASREKVFHAISNPEKVVLWFPETLEGKYEVGEQAVFGFGEQGKAQILVVDSKPYSYFSYRWVPGANHFLGDLTQTQTTLVEFQIEEISENSCKLILTESGFNSIPEKIRSDAFKQNSGGWDFMLGRLSDFLK